MGKPFDGDVLEDDSLFAQIERISGERVAVSGEWLVSAVKASSEQATFLGISVGDPLLRSNVKFLADDGQPLCLERQYFVGSRYELSI